MQNHTNAAVTIHQEIAEKFVGVAQKISTEDVVERDWVEKAGHVHRRIRLYFFHHVF